VYLAYLFVRWWRQNEEAIDKAIDAKFFSKHWRVIAKTHIAVIYLSIIAWLKGYSRPTNPMFIKDVIEFGERHK
jgi:hypothetical protein